MLAQYVNSLPLKQDVSPKGAKSTTLTLLPCLFSEQSGRVGGGVTGCDSRGEAMSSSGQLLHSDSPATPAMAACDRRWYAIRSRSRHEKKIIGQLEKQSIEAYLPTVTQVRNWSDRRKLVEMPLFPGYAFVRLAYPSSDRLHVLCTHGVVSFVGINGAGTPIPDEQIHNIRTLLANNIPCRSHAFLKVGQRVRVRGGALDGVEGILMGHRDDRSLIVSVEVIQRSLCIRIAGYDVDPVR